MKTQSQAARGWAFSWALLFACAACLAQAPGRPDPDEVAAKLRSMNDAQLSTADAKRKEQSAYYMQAAEQYHQVRDYEKVIRYATLSIQSSPSALAYHRLSNAYAKLAEAKDPDSLPRRDLYMKSEGAARKALALSPDNQAVLEALAWAKLNLRMFPEAGELADRALRVNPHSAMARVVRAFVAEHEGRVDDEISELRAAEAAQPGFFGAQIKAVQAGERLFEPAPASDFKPLELLSSGRSARLGMILGALGLLALAGFWIKFWLDSRSGQDGPRPRKPPEPSPEEAGGLLAGKYQLVRIIGVGGMGQVWEAMDGTLQRAVAVKKMAMGPQEPAGFSRELYLKEARMLASLHHPNIVDIYDVLDLPSGLYLVFELLAGKTVQHLLAERKRLPLGECRSILRPVCAALQFAHGMAVIHRDLKPSNIMATDRGFIKVMDFGIARRIGDAPAGGQKPGGGEGPLPLSARTRTVMGTPAYMAPEAEEGLVSPALDVYSLGVCLYEMLAGERPFPENGRSQKLEGYFIPASLKAPGLPPGTDPFLRRCLDPDPERRIRSIPEFRSGIDSLT